MKILVIEDDERLAGVLERGFRERRVDVVRARDFAEGRERLLFGAHDVIVLDLMLPGGDGADLCRLARDRGITTPILMLTARDAVADRVRGLETGADDYLTKPFAFPELAARVRALVRRDSRQPTPILRAGGIELDPAQHRATYQGLPVTLAPREFAVLEYLLRRRGEAVTRTEIEEHCWGGDFEGLSNVIDVYVSQLRRATGGRRSPIETVRGVGYRLRADP